MNIFSFTSPGPRGKNQDFFVVRDFGQIGFLLAVADGVGGNRGGEVASRVAIEEFCERVGAGSELGDAIKSAHEKVLSEAAINPELKGMATTLSSVVFRGHGRLRGVHPGDSRVYLLRGNGIKQLTLDHTELAKLLASGQLSKEEAVNYPRKNVLTSAVGAGREFVYQDFEFNLEGGDRVLVLSDGVYGVLSKAAIRDLSLMHSDFLVFCESIVEAVEVAGPKDNFTLVAAEIEV